MRVHFTSLGCKLNQAEIESLARRFAAAGHSVVPTLDAADLHVVNSCTVTHQAARDSRKAAGRGARRGGGVRTVLTGCYAADPSGEAARLAGVDLVVGNHEKERLLERVEAAFPELAIPDLPYLPLPALGDALPDERTRALIKIEDGCNMRCAFCIIPSTRGGQRSRPPAEIVEEVRSRVEAGVREIVLTGVQISAFSYRPPTLQPTREPAAAHRGRPLRLAGLVREILERCAVPRLRLTSIAPWDLDDELLALWGEPRLARHVHLSLQSGCTATLARMRRPYTAEGYLELLARVRRAVPGMAVTTDVIVGFPGETEEELAASCATVTAAGFAKVHVFPYSARAGTEAAALPGALAPEVVRRRMERMLAIAADAERAFAAAHVGSRATVLWERPKNGMGQGLTDNYLRVVSADGVGLRNEFSPVELLEVTEQGLRCALLPVS